MPRVRKSLYALSCLLLIGLLLPGLFPATALAAVPGVFPAQETLDMAADEGVEGAPLIYVSDLLPSASGGGRLLTLILEPDATVSLSTNFLNGELPVVEIGSWEADPDAGIYLVTLTGTAALLYDLPVAWAFAEAADGSLIAVEWDEAMFGSEALVLYPAESAAMAGVYVSDVMPSAISPGRVFTLALAYDGTATLAVDFLDGEVPVEYGTWVDDQAGTLLLTLTSSDFGPYVESPNEWLFAIAEDGSLTAVSWDEAVYGPELLTLARPVEEAPAPADGVWVSDILPAASSPGQVVLLILYADGELQSSTWYLNKAMPIIENGTWLDNGDGTVTLTVTGSVEGEYDLPQELIFDYDGETLSYLSLTLHRVEEVESLPGPEPVAFYATDVLPAASSAGLQRSLVLFNDGSISLVSDYLNGEEPVVEVGTWQEDGAGNLIVTVTGRAEQAYDMAVMITFAVADGTLTALEWDESIFGSEGLLFTEQDLDALMMDESAPAGDAPAGDPPAGDALASDASAGSAPLEESVPLLMTEGLTVTETLTSEAAPEASVVGSEEMAVDAPFVAPEGASAVYRSDILPAASSPGRLIRLVFFADGSCQMVTDYLNGESPVLEIGTWADGEPGEIEVTLAGQIASPYATPVVITFAQTGDTLVAVEWDEAIYGAEPLTLTQEPIE